MEEKITKIIGFSQQPVKSNDDIQPLQQFLDSGIDLQDIIEIVPNLIKKKEGPHILSRLFLGLTHKPSSQKKKYKIIETALITMKSVTFPVSDTAAIVQKLIPEFSKLQTFYLVNLNEILIKFVQENKDPLRTFWKDIIPRILNLISEKKEVNYEDAEISGTEYKEQIIQTLCSSCTTPITLIPLASMFTDISLTSEEHLSVVQKLSEEFDNLDLEKLPAYVQQLLHLCKEEHSIVVFLKLRNFFSKNLRAISEKEDVDEEKVKTLFETEVKILQHIEECARITRLSDLMKLCKNAVHAPNLILDPFLLSVLLILYCIPAYEMQISEILRNMIAHAVNEEDRKKDSAWLSHIIDNHFNIDETFAHIMQNRLCERDDVLNGLTNLGFMLLATSSVKSKEVVSKKMWRLGRIILVSLVKKHKKTAKTILQTLTDCIITGCISQQYTDCLLHLCNVATMVVVDNFAIVTRILEFITGMSGIVSQRIITALIPLVQISPSLRDTLIMCLRKALVSRNVEIRQTAVMGFLQLLKFLKLQRYSALSQNTLSQTVFNGPSVFTQICLDVHSQQTFSQPIKLSTNSNINEAICLEVLGVLRRCFMQQSLVKTTLYRGLYGAISVNTELCGCVLDLLLDHFGQYYVSDVNVLPPIQFDKVVVLSGCKVVLQEPVGHLLLLIQDVLAKTRTLFAEDDEAACEQPPRSLAKFSEIMQSLVDRFYICNLKNFDLDDDVDLTDSSPKNTQIFETIQEVLSVYEALMAYVINSWTTDTPPQTATKLVALHKCFSSIVEFAKTEKTNKKKDDESGDKRTKKGLNKEKSTKKHFKIPSTILSLKTIHRLLSLFLLDEIDWTTSDIIHEIKPRRRLFNYAMNSSLDVVKQLNARLNDEQRSSSIFNDIVSLAKLLFLRCISRYTEISEYEPGSAITSVECFSEIIFLVLTHYKSKFGQFLEETIFVRCEEGLPKQLLPILKAHKNLLSIVLTTELESDNVTVPEEDVHPSTKLLTSVLMNSLHMIVMTFPTGNETTNKVLDWLISIAEKHSIVNVNNAKVFMNLLFTMYGRCRKDLTLFDSISLQLCHIFPSINEATHEKSIRPLKMITDDNKTVILPMVCSMMITSLDDVEYMITRFKSENFVYSYVSDVDETPVTQCNILKRREKELCEHVTHVTLMTQMLVSIAAPTGPCLDSVVKLLIRTFSLLSILAKYFVSRSSVSDPVYQHASFHKLVKIAASQFMRQEASELLLYVEKDYENENKKKLNQLTSQGKKQYVLLPKLVSELESFPNAVLQLSKKCKDASLSHNVKLTITRDFRLNVKKVDELIGDRNEANEDSEEAMDVDQLGVGAPISSANPSRKRKKTK